MICSMNASAALIVYEGFDYADGTSLRTQTGAGESFSGSVAREPSSLILVFAGMLAFGGRRFLRRPSNFCASSGVE